jgi:hypothetical protein
MMQDAQTRLLEAQRALHRLALKVEQYRLHVSELEGHPQEAEQARAVLEKLIADLALQRKYCQLLARASGREGLPARTSRRA